MEVIKDRDYEEYVSLLPIQYNDSDKLREFLRTYLDSVQSLNEAQLELSEINTDFKTATGYQLDLIGKLVGAERKGRTDSNYRDYILFKISVNIGSGTPEDVINYLSIATNATRIRYFEHYPACTVLETNGTTIPPAIPSTLDNVTPAGVRTGGVMVLIDDYGFRPVELSTAYDNEYPYDPLGGFSKTLGEVTAELGTMELRYHLSYSSFFLPDSTTLLGQGVYPELSDINNSGNIGKRAELLTDKER